MTDQMRSPVLATAALVIATGVALLAQAPAAPAAQNFEVASVKPSNPNPTGPLGGAPMVLPALGRLTAQNVTFRMLVMTAYDRQPFQIFGGPPWQNSNKFDITAKAEDGSATLDQMRIMLRGLLADRFKLTAHIETREVPIYELVLARGDKRLGPKMKASTDTCPDFKEQQQKMLEAIAKGGVGALQSMLGKPGENKPCSITQIPPTPDNLALGFKATGQSLELLVTLLTQLSGRPVVDKTGLSGPHDFELSISLQSLAALYQELGITLPLPPGLPEGPALMTTVQEDLGLKLDSQRGPSEVLVVDGAELPTAD
jgi:uncharacterized protein (TIGR03435 family)